MSRPLYDIAQNCAGLVNSPDDPEVLGYAISGIQEGIDFLNLRVWNFQLRTSGFALVANQRDYLFSSGVRATRHFSLMNGNSRKTVDYLDTKSFFLECPSVQAGEAEVYTLLAGTNQTNTVRMNAAPTVANLTTWPSGEFTYYARINYPATSGSTIDVPPEVERVLMEYARVYVAERYDPTKAASPQKRFDLAFRQLRINESLNETTDWSESGGSRY